MGRIFFCCNGAKWRWSSTLRENTERLKLDERF